MALPITIKLFASKDHTIVITLHLLAPAIKTKVLLTLLMEHVQREIIVMGTIAR